MSDYLKIILDHAKHDAFNNHSKVEDEFAKLCLTKYNVGSDKGTPGTFRGDLNDDGKVLKSEIDTAYKFATEGKTLDAAKAEYKTSMHADYKDAGYQLPAKTSQDKPPYASISTPIEAAGNYFTNNWNLPKTVGDFIGGLFK